MTRNPDRDEMEQLGECEGVEIYKYNGETLYLTAEALREGADGILLTYDSLQNLAVEHRDEMGGNSP